MTPDDPDASHAEQTVECAPARSRWKRVLTWIAIGVGSTLVFLILAAVTLYNFGGMWGSAVPGMGEQYGRLVASGEAPPPRKRFVIPIPGCQCHSTDAVLTAQHSKRHMNECSRCHNTNPAHMEPGVL